MAPTQRANALNDGRPLSTAKSSDCDLISTHSMLGFVRQTLSCCGVPTPLCVITTRAIKTSHLHNTLVSVSSDAPLWGAEVSRPMLIDLASGLNSITHCVSGIPLSCVFRLLGIRSRPVRHKTLEVHTHLKTRRWRKTLVPDCAVPCLDVKNDLMWPVS